MAPATGWIFYGLIFSILSILVVFHFFILKRNLKDSYLFHIRKNNIDWKKVRNFYIVFNILSYIASINNDSMNTIDVFLIPIAFISFILTYWFIYPDPGERQKAINKIDQKDFEKYKKSWDDKEKAKKREEKIHKILK